MSMEHIGDTINKMGNTKDITHNLKNNPDVPEDIQEDNYGCDLCQGFGRVHPISKDKADFTKLVPCICQKELSKSKRLKALINYCELPPEANNMTLKDLEIYPEIKTAYNVAQGITTNPNKPFWLVLLGENNVGKTHIAIAICQELIKQGILSKYIATPILLDDLRAGFDEQGSNSYDAKFKRYCNVPVLLLDDLGMQVTTPWVREKLESLLDYRVMNNLSTIVTSNNTLEEFSDRLRARLIRPPYRKIIVINAEDYILRKLKRKEK